MNSFGVRSILTADDGRWTAAGTADGSFLPPPAFCRPISPIRLEIFEHPLASTFPSVARFPISAKSGRCVEKIRAVDPHHSRLHFRRDIQCEVDVLAPNARGQSKRRIVRERDRFFGRTKTHR